MPDRLQIYLLRSLLVLARVDIVFFLIYKYNARDMLLGWVMSSNKHFIRLHGIKLEITGD